MLAVLPYSVLEGLAKLPALAKLGLFLIIWVILWFPVAVPLGRRLQWQPWHPTTIAQKLPLIAILYVLVPLMAWGVTQIDSTSLLDYGLVWDLSLLLSLLQGLILGIGGIGLVFSLEGFLGWLQWHRENAFRLVSISLPLLLLSLWIGLTEELVFRGIFFTQLRQDYPIWLAATISSAIFALLHLVWERQETTPQLLGLWVMGMVLVSARLVDGNSLGLAWGLHSGWIWGLTVLDSAKLMSYTDKGSVWLTGLYGHPLAGLAGLLCLLGTSLILWQVPLS